MIVNRHNNAAIQDLNTALGKYEANEFPLPGIKSEQNRLVFIKQLIDSMRRVEYVSVVEGRPIDAERGNPTSVLFDPLKAALLQKQIGNIDEACWLVFLFVHFGKHRHSGWRLVGEVYGRLKQKPYWDWSEISVNPEDFRDWLRDHQQELKAAGGFGNHRKYQSLDADKPAGTGAAVTSYVSWVTQYGGHKQLIHHACEQSANDPKKAFHSLYQSMKEVVSFGRTAKFDYLTMLAKAGLAPIEPGSAYMGNSTGPIKGARLMLEDGTHQKLSVQELEHRLTLLAQYLGVGMQVIEDSLCNWQKKPSKYTLFSG